MFLAAVSYGSSLHESGNARNGRSGGPVPINGGDFCLKTTRCSLPFFWTAMERFLTNSDT
jgi:hypothetical protein